jgi:hypothetical protein
MPVEIRPRGDTVSPEAGAQGADTLLLASTLAQRVMRDLEAAATMVTRWRKEAGEADRFMAGRQWHPADEARLNEEDRPTAIFNFAQKYIRIVAGTEKHNRQEIVFVPRAPQAPGANAAGELASAVYSSVIDACNGPEERSQSFEDLLVRGMGWTHVRLDLELDPDGRIVLERVDGMKMHWDPAARKQNLEDARWVACEQEIPLAEALRRWPEKRRELQVAEFVDEGAGQAREVEHVTPIAYQPENETIIPARAPSGYVRVIEYQYYDIEPCYRLADPLRNRICELDAAAFRRLRARLEPTGIGFADAAAEAPAGDGPDATAALVSPRATADPSRIWYVRQDRRVYKRVFTAGPVELEARRLPVQNVGFTYKAITGSFDAHERVYRGLLHVLMDPQRFANKFFSQTLHIINSNAKGGLLAEASAFADPLRAEQDWANPSALILLEEGALSGPRPRIQERSRPALPEGTFVMLKWCVDALGGVSGINPELLGATTGDVPGVAQRQRQVQGMTINAGYFSALTRYLREEARTVFEFIRNFVADGRMVTIGGPYDARAIPLLRERLPVDYTLVIDEPTKSPNAKEAFWERMAPIVPVLVKNNAFLPDILDYSPFPASIAARLKQQLQARMAAAAHPVAPAIAPAPGAARDPREIAAAVGQKLSAAQLSQARARAVERESRVRQLGGLVGAAGRLARTLDRERQDQLAYAGAVAELIARHGRAR